VQFLVDTGRFLEPVPRRDRFVAPNAGSSLNYSGSIASALASFVLSPMTRMGGSAPNEQLY